MGYYDYDDYDDGRTTLLMEPSALKHWIVTGIGLDKAHGSTGIIFIAY